MRCATTRREYIDIIMSVCAFVSALARGLVGSVGFDVAAAAPYLYLFYTPVSHIYYAHTTHTNALHPCLLCIVKSALTYTHAFDDDDAHGTFVSVLCAAVDSQAYHTQHTQHTYATWVCVSVSV